MSYRIKPRELRKDEIAIVPFDDNIFFVILEDKQNTRPKKQKYKVQMWNKEFNSYGETDYDLTYFQARNRLAKKITF